MHSARSSSSGSLAMSSARTLIQRSNHGTASCGSPRRDRADIYPLSVLDDRTLRKEYTQNVLGGLPVLARVPAVGSVKNGDNVEVIPADGLFGIQILRCHQSQDPPRAHVDIDDDVARHL